jgi:hypothetical protein
MNQINHFSEKLIVVLFLAAILLAGCIAVQPERDMTGSGTVPAPGATSSDIVLIWEGQPLNTAEAGACGRLQVSAGGQATVGACDAGDGETQPLGATHAQEWTEMQTRFAPFEAETENGSVTFHGAGESAAEAWQPAIAAWAQLVHAELSADQFGAGGPAILSWQLGEASGESTLCRRLTVLVYGYAYARTEPCAGGPLQASTGGWLQDEAMTELGNWLRELAPVYVENNYLAGNGAQETSETQIAAFEAWAENVYAQLAGAAPAGAVAFVRDGVLYIQQDAPNGSAVAVEDCGNRTCRILYPKWSPTGSHLLYYHEALDDTRQAEIRIADHEGQTQRVADGIASYRPPAWSPDGASVVYFVNTERFQEQATQGQVRILEVWTAGVDAGGGIHDAQQRGEIGFGEGCGGGGRSNSALVYEEEGGFAYGYLAAIAEWTPAGILLYSNNCTSRGVGRFDMTTGQEIEPYEGELRSLSLDSSGARWAAIDGENRIVLGAPDTLTYRGLDNVTLDGAAPELVFFGPASGRLYYTTLERTGETAELVDELSRLDTAFPVQPFFDFTQPALYAFDVGLNESSLLWQGDGYAYARLAETAGGDLLFSRVESNEALFEALQAGAATANNIDELLPTADVLRLSPGASTPDVWLENARQFRFTIAEPAAPAETEAPAALDQRQAPALAWHRQGGSAAFCDDVTVDVTGEVYVSSCRDQQPEDLAHFRLDAGQLATLFEWLDAYAPFEYSWSDAAQTAPVTVTLVFSGAGELAAMTPDQALIADFAQNLFNEGGMAAREAPAACAQLEENQQVLIQEEYGYCLLYPAAYSLWQLSPGTMEIISGTIMNHIDPRASITVEAANGRTLDEVVAQLVADYAPPGFEVEPQTITVDGVEATMLDEVPGQDLTRRVVLIHNDRLYRFFFAPIGEAGTETRQQAELLYQTVIESFRLLEDAWPSSFTPNLTGFTEC